jgi:hypothetical protein
VIADALNESISGVMERRLREPAQRDMVVVALMAGFARLNKKPVANEAERLKKLQERIYKMSEDVKLNFVNGRLVVKVPGSSEALMTELRRGSDWYDPWDKVDDILLAAILVDPEK